MALPINIEDLIRQRTVERTRIEYKADWNPEPIIHSITAFANDFDNLGGGYIIIGIEEENGRPVFPIKGLNSESLDHIQLDLLNKCNFIEPRYIPVVEPYTIDGKDILVLWVPGGEERPYKSPEKIYSEQNNDEQLNFEQNDLTISRKKKKNKNETKSPKVYWIRKASRTMKANHMEERELIEMARSVPFDDRINYHANVDDMRLSLMAEYLKAVGSDLHKSVMARSIGDVATDMKLVRGPVEYRKPLNVGLMFFNDDPEEYFEYSRIEVVDKPDPTGMGMTEKIFRGPLDKQLRDALSYIQNYILKEYVTKVPDRAEAIRVFNWPYQAIEEALTNAVYHKSYQIHEPITVTVTPEKLTILSLPGPDWSISDEDLERRVLISKRYRNRRIGDFLKELKMAEGRNTGVPLIVRAMKENGSKEPKFLTDEERSYFEIELPIHPIFTGHDKNTVKDDNVEIDKILSDTNHRTRRSREEIKELIIATLNREGNLSMNEIAESLGYTALTNTVRDVVKELFKEGMVVYLYPDKPRSRNQKICLVQDRLDKK